MTTRTAKIPKHWLNLRLCGHIFRSFRGKIEFDEPIPRFETRYPGQLEGILGSVKQTYGKEYLNKTVLDAAAAYFNQFVRGHAFENGNKRMAVMFTHFFLLKHGVDFDMTPSDMYNLAIFVARSGEKGITANQTKEWCKRVIRDFTKDLETSRPGKGLVPDWRRLISRMGRYRLRGFKKV